MPNFITTRHIEIERDYQGINLTEFIMNETDGLSNDQIVDLFIHSKSFTYDSLRDCIKKAGGQGGYLGHAFETELINVADFKKSDKQGIAAYLKDYIESEWGKDYYGAPFNFLIEKYMEIHNQLPDSDFYLLNKEWFADDDQRVRKPQQWCYTYYFLILYINGNNGTLLITEWTYD